MPTNAVILYGQDACNRFVKLIDRWQAILQPAEWSQYSFLLVCPETPTLTLTPQMRRCLNGRVWPMQRLDVAAAQPVANQLLSAMGAGTLRVHCVCSNFSHVPAPAEELKSFLQALERSVVIDISTVFYMVVTTDAEEKAAQRRFLEALQGYARYLYLLSPTTHTFAIESLSFVWNALIEELYINGRGMRALTPGLYSLGYVTLNANGSELDDLMRHFYIQDVAMAQVQQMQENGEAITLRLLTGSTAAPAADQLDAFVQRWMEHFMNGRMSYPSEEKLKNNRILCAAYDGSLEQAEAGIVEFFDMNVTALNAEQIGAEWLQRVGEELRHQAETAALSTDMLTKLEAALKRLHTQRIAFDLPALPSKKPWEMKAAYRERCCDVIERACYRYTIRKKTSELAGVFAKQVKALAPLAGEGNGVMKYLTDQLLPASAVQQLTEKYPAYAQELHNAITPRVGQLFCSGKEAFCFYNEVGAVDEAGWDGAIRSGMSRLMNLLPSAYQSSFFDTLQAEYPTQSAMGQFMSQYLTVSKRYFYHSTPPLAPEPIFLADQAIVSHPWFNGSTTVCCDNDNVERVDQYRMEVTLKDWLNEATPPSPFLDAAPINMSPLPAGEAPLADGFVSFAPLVLSVNDEDEEAKPTDAANCLESDSTHDLRMLRKDGSYFLTWDWHGSQNGALVSLSQNGRYYLSSLPCGSVAFHSGGHRYNVSANLTEPLPYGMLHAEVFDANGTLYASNEVVGRMDDMVYHIETMRDGKCKLSIPNSSYLDVCSVAMRVDTADGKTTFYPLRPTPTLTYSGLVLNGEAELVSSPQKPYPTVTPIRK